MSATVTIRESYFKRSDGTIFMRRQIGTHVLWEGVSPVVFVKWSAADVPWDLIHKPVTELVKEGPKAMVVYGRD
jgi:hypothetical protein